ncbi:unnamed protein product [Camellia sinensis]
MWDYCYRAKYHLMACFVLHIKHSSEIYQEKLSKALAHHFEAKLLAFHSYLYPSGSFTTGPKQILEVVMAQLCQEVRPLVVQYIQGIVPSVGKWDMLHSSNAALHVPVSQKTKNRCVKNDMSLLVPSTSSARSVG